MSNRWRRCPLDFWTPRTNEFHETDSSARITHETDSAARINDLNANDTLALTQLFPQYELSQLGDLVSLSFELFEGEIRMTSIVKNQYQQTNELRTSVGNMNRLHKLVLFNAGFQGGVIQKSKPYRFVV